MQFIVTQQRKYGQKGQGYITFIFKLELESWPDKEACFWIFLELSRWK